MKQEIFINKKQTEEFYNSLTEQEKSAMNKLMNENSKVYFSAQAERQNKLQSAFTKFIQTKKIK